MKKALLVATVQHHFTAFHLPLIKMLQEHGYEVHVAARNVMGDEIKGILESVADKVFDIPFERSPFNAGNKAAYKQLKKLVDENGYDVVHCNTPVGGILARIAARKARKSGCTVIYTAHGFHFYKGASKKNWLVFYPIERFFGRHLTDCLITVCDEDYKTATDKKLCKNVRQIHSVGVDNKKFEPVSTEQKLALRRELGFDENAVICLCTGELNENKNQKLLVGAVPEVIKACPNFVLLLAGNGEKDSELSAQAQALGVEGSVKLLGYRTDVDKLACACDFIAAVSLREGLPVNVIEAMMCAKPAVVTHNRGHNELVADGESGIFVPSADCAAAAKAITTLCKDEKLRGAMGEKALERSAKYSIDRVLDELNKIYSEFVFNKY